MLSSVWGTLTYHTLWGCLQCGQSACSTTARQAATYRVQLCNQSVNHLL